MHTRTCRDRYPPGLLSLFELLPDPVGSTALGVEPDQLLRIVSGKDHRIVNEMFRGSKRARETSQ